MIVIIGGGIVGLVMAAALSKRQLPVTLIESQLPLLNWQPEELDAKVSAINNFSQQILLDLNVWPQLLAQSFCPLRSMQVWDHVGGGEIQFDSAEVGAAQMGFIVENRALIKALWEQLQNNAFVKILCPRRPLQIIRGGDKALQLILDDQTVVPAELVIGADGGRSWVREEMGMRVHERPYQQQALIGVVSSEKPHQMRALQNFLPTGPLGILPLADNHTNAIVWSNDLRQAERLLSLSPADFNKELSLALNYRLGALTCLSPLTAIPLMMRHAHDYVQPRLALIGDAAHTIHPLAGQGVNLGLMDAMALMQVIADGQRKGHDIGSLRVLKRYQRWRRSDNLIMMTAMSGFKELFGSETTWLVYLRSQGLNLTNQTSLLKRALMRYAMGHGIVPSMT